MKIRARFLILWLDMYSDPKWPKCSFWVPEPKVKIFFGISWFYSIYLIILEQMRSCLLKLELGILTTGLISPLPKALGPICPKLVFRFQTPNVNVLGSQNFFMSSSIKFYIKWALIFKFWVNYDKVISVYFQKIAKTNFKNILFGAISKM